LLLARDVELLNAEECTDLTAQASEVRRMLTGLHFRRRRGRGTFTSHARNGGGAYFSGSGTYLAGSLSNFFLQSSEQK